MHDGDPAVHRIIDFARQLEGVARNASTHAAGVVISREPLAELMPLQKATNSDATMTQYEMHGIEALGLLKFDFLGLSNLTILRAAVDRIREQRGVEIDLERIPLDDAATFALLASGETTGIFQLESAGMRRYIRELRPTSVYDLAAMVALYRPGPMENIPAYIRRKHGQEKVAYLHPLLEPFLERTHGIFVYQEDIMAAAVALGGFSGPEADTLGYAIRKKKSSVLRSMKAQFVKQAGERGVLPHTIDAVFKAFEPFERYGFNKAHATTYGLVAYQTAYLKANYTVEYMASVLTAFRDSAEKVAAAVAECRRLGIAVLAPDVHASHLEFTVEGPSIRFGLLAVKNVGQGAIESIIAARESEGPFRSFADFCNRIDLRLVNKRVLESLVKVGALNAFGHPAQLLVALDDVLAAAQADQRERASGQISFFDLAAEPGSLEAPLPAATEVPVRERLRWEKELLGLYLSDHPLGEVAERIGKFVTAWSGELKDESLDGQRVVVGGVVTGIRTVITKTRSTMAVATLEDLQGAAEVVIFPRLYEQTGPTWQEGAILLVAGRIDHRGEEVSLLADLVRDFDVAEAGGEEAFAAEVAAADRGRPRGRPGANGNGISDGQGAGTGAPVRRTAPPPTIGPLRGDASPTIAPPSPPAAPARVTPLRAAPEREVGSPEPAGLEAAAPDREESPLPDEARAAALGAAAAPTVPREAGPDGRLHVRFAAGIPAEDLQAAMAEVRDVLRNRPGATRVTIHLPQGPGRPGLPMELRAGVAYDAELAAEVARRLRPGLVDLALTSDPEGLAASA
jgi:DNA polymerase-3 subunit alpha